MHSSVPVTVLIIEGMDECRSRPRLVRTSTARSMQCLWIEASLLVRRFPDLTASEAVHVLTGERAFSIRRQLSRIAFEICTSFSSCTKRSVLTLYCQFLSDATIMYLLYKLKNPTALDVAARNHLMIRSFMDSFGTHFCAVSLVQ